MAKSKTVELLGLSSVVLVVLGLIFFRGGPPKGSTTESKTGKLPLRLAYFPNLTHAPALIGVADGYFERSLPGFNFQTKVVNAGPEAMEALLAGAIDAAYVGPSPAINTYIKSGGSALRIIAGACEGGASLIARKGVVIHGLKDLGGKRVAVPQIGGTQDVSLRHFLSQVGLSSKEKRGTVEITPIKNPDILALFKQGQLDAAWVPEPWAARLKTETGATTVIDERDLWKDRKFTTTVLVVSKKFEAAHPGAVEALVAANGQIVDWIGSNPAKAKETLNSSLSMLTGKPLPREVLDEAWGRVAFVKKVDQSNVIEFASAAHDAGYLEKVPGTLDPLFAKAVAGGSRE